MFSGTKKLWLVAGFTVAVVVLVNLAWWVFYDRTAQLLDHQVTRRLHAMAAATAVGIPGRVVEGLLEQDLDAYLTVLQRIEQVRQADSLADVFVLDENYNYLATSAARVDTLYFLTTLNSQYIDSVFYTTEPTVVVSETYQTGDLFLKTAFAPLTGRDGVVIAVLGVEANVDYFDVLESLRSNLWYSGILSLVGGIVFGVLFLLYQRRVNKAEQTAFVNETHAYLGRMVAVVSHEIKNPLMIIRASAERLAKKTDAAEGGFIVEETDRLNEIVTGYLDVARAKGKLLETERREQFDLDQLVRNIRSHLGQKYADTEITWLGPESPPPVSVTGYPRSLRQVLLNLLINGAEASLEAGKPVAVGVTYREDAESVTLEVIDHGPGLKKQERARLFTPFYTTKNTGSGLGLYLTKRIIEEMRGTLAMESKIGEGTTVRIAIPKHMDS